MQQRRQQHLRAALPHRVAAPPCAVSSVVPLAGVIGQGGSGVVYQGLWRGLTVAVKTLVFTVLPMQPMSRKQHRAMTEAALCRTLQHPHIVATYAYDLHTLMAAAAGGSHGGGGRAGGSGQSGGASGGAGGGGVTVAPGAAHAMEFKLFIIQGERAGALDFLHTFFPTRRSPVV